MAPDKSVNITFFKVEIANSLFYGYFYFRYHIVFSMYALYPGTLLYRGGNI